MVVIKLIFFSVNYVFEIFEVQNKKMGLELCDLTQTRCMYIMIPP